MQSYIQAVKNLKHLKCDLIWFKSCMLIAPFLMYVDAELVWWSSLKTALTWCRRWGEGRSTPASRPSAAPISWPEIRSQSGIWVLRNRGRTQICLQRVGRWTRRLHKSWAGVYHSRPSPFLHNWPLQSCSAQWASTVPGNWNFTRFKNALPCGGLCHRGDFQWTGRSTWNRLD